MTITIIDDQRSEDGTGLVDISNNAGLWRLDFNSHMELDRAYGRNRFNIGAEGIIGDTSPAASGLLEYVNIRSDRLANAPRGAYAPFGNITVCITPMDLMPGGQHPAEKFLRREDWRLRGSNPDAYYGSPERMMSVRQWEDWAPQLLEVYDWALTQYPTILPRVPSQLYVEVDSARRNADIYWKRYKAAENQLLSAQDTLAKAKQRHAEAMAAHAAVA